jgi:plastocyanin
MIPLITGVILSLASAAAPADAQGTVTGQVSLQERPGESTTDLGNTVIYLTPMGPPPRMRANMKEQMAMQARQFSPRVRVVTVGSRIDFPNQDPFSHNIFSNAPGAAFDLGLYGRGVSKHTEFKKPGAFPVYCNIHSRMTGFIVVVPSPYFTQAGADGRYTLADVPEGRYRLHVWHERAPEHTREITVPASGTVTAEVQLDASGFRFVQHRNKFGQDYKASGERY